MTDDAGTESDADSAETDGGPADSPENAGTDGDSESSERTDDNGNGNGDSAPHVELSMYQLSVSVRGSGDDGLDDVSEAARDLMDYLAEKSVELEERPDDRGLG
jgi:hypothetical protein